MPSEPKSSPEPRQESQSPSAEGTSDGIDRNDPRWNSDSKTMMRRVEAVLFLSRVPLSSRKLAQLAVLDDGTQARTQIKELNRHYDEVGRSFQVKHVAGGYQLLTRPQFSKWIRQQEHVPRPRRLSGPAMETLGVVAYRQPIIKAEIEAIRGVSCGEMLRQLLEIGLIKIAGRSPELGRPFLYVTTKDFLSTYGLGSIDDLPRSDQLVGKGLPENMISSENYARPQNDPSENHDPPQEESL